LLGRKFLVFTVTIKEKNPGHRHGNAKEDKEATIRGSLGSEDTVSEFNTAR